MNKFKLPLLVVGAAILMSTLTACGTKYTDPSLVALRYSAGLTEGGKFVECVKPGSKTVTNDTYYYYPTTQREDVWDSNTFNKGTKSADQGDMEVIDKDGNTAYLKVKVSFSLNTDCDTLRAFHEKIGRTRHAYFNEDGKYDDGWLWAMDNYISSAVVEKTRAAATKYSVEDMWLNPATRQAMAAEIQEVIQSAVNDGMEGNEEFYKVESIRIFNANPTQAFTDIYQERKNANVRAQTAEANKKAQIAEAEAKAAVARKEADVRKAEIDGFGSVDAYLKSKMIDKGLNPYQPTYGGNVAAPSN